MSAEPEKCPQCGSDDPCGLAIGCDAHQHPFHDKANQKRAEVKELEKMHVEQARASLERTK